MKIYLEKSEMRVPSAWAILLGTLVLGSIAGIVWVTMFRDADGNKTAKKLTLDKIPVDGKRAYGYLKDICKLGRRYSGSKGMQKQQKLLEKHFTKLGAKVSLQKFRAIHPLTGKRVDMANMLIQWHPEKDNRILLCAHYDTRPFPDSDRRKPQGKFIGANDGASGVALLMELAHHMGKLKSNYGVDFVLFDAEELIYVWQNQYRGEYFLGSKHFANLYKNKPPGFKYRWGVLLDMVGDKDLKIYMEGNSASWQDTYPMTKEIWATAKDLGVIEFKDSVEYTVNDDHLALRNIAAIPTCDIIDFHYPNEKKGNIYWHTTKDVPSNCSALSLAKVGWVVLKWLETTK